MKSFYRSFYVLLLLVITGVQAQNASFSFPEKEFATPEAAIQYFAESIAKNDVVAALQAYAINQQAELFDFTAMSERLQVVSPRQMLSPSEFPLYVELNRLVLLSRYAEQLKFFAYSFYYRENEAFKDGELEQTILIQDNPELVSEFIASVNPERLANLTVARTLRFIATSEKMIKVFQDQAKTVGADDVTELIILYELDGSYYLGGARALRYGKSWKLDGLYSALAGVTGSGTVTKTTQAEFDEILDELGESDNWTLEENQN